MTRIGFTSRGLVLALGVALGTGCGDDDGPDDVPDSFVPPADLGSDAGGGDDAGGEDDAGGDDAGGDGGSPSDVPASFEMDVASAQCAALFRCCDADSIQRFFDRYACFGGGLACDFEDQQDAIPPTSETECVALMLELDEITMGEALTQARAGVLDYDAAAQTACLADLSGAACGDELSAALDDPTCYGWQSAGGPGVVPAVYHAMFERTGAIDDDCVSLYNDSYGTCDPASAFCCVGAACDGPGEAGRAGTCQAAIADGGDCSVFDGAPCVEGLACVDDGLGGDATCQVPPTPTPLALGDDCFDPLTFSSLGECADSYCDENGTNQCESRLTNGETCNGDAQCVSGNCENVAGGGPFVTFECADPSFCVGT